jgi:hypothetical protein
MILFQSQIAEHQQLAEHYRELAAKREALVAGLTAVQQQADSDLTSLKLLVDKCKELAPSTIASLKNAVLNLFDSGDDGNDGRNQPTDPTPQPDDDEPELLCLNGAQLLTPSASYKVIQVMPNGILDCENTTTGLRLGLRPAAVSLVQKANTKVPIAECSIVDAPLEQPEPTELTITSAQWEELKKLATDGGLSQEQLGDIALAPYDYQRGSQIKTSQFAEVKRKLERAIANIRIAKENQQMLDGIAATVFDQKFQQQNTRLSMGATHGR